MTAALALRSGIAETMDELFEPAELHPIEKLFAEYLETRAKVDQIADVFEGADLAKSVDWFLVGSSDPDERDRPVIDFAKVFRRVGAVAALDASFWDRALKTTDVWDTMPQARRNEWHEQIRCRKTAPFTVANVMSTIQDQLGLRRQYFAERVDGVFRVLSGEHVTNSPMGFRKRMIINYVHDGDFAGTVTVDHVRAGYIHDLRKVIARFMGREEPTSWITTSQLIHLALRRTGEWLDCDGGSFRLRVYKRRTAHLEVHDEMAWRLNNVLAYLHPTAVASEHRVRPARKAKVVQLFGRPLPFAVVKCLANLDFSDNSVTCNFGYSTDRHVQVETIQVLQGLGGVGRKGARVFDFDFDPRDAIELVVASGCVPDQKAHQYYPTPTELAAHVVELADIGLDDLVLEPSAGQGGIADLLPKDRTLCIEVSALHCAVLRAKGFDVVAGDFLAVLPTDVGLHTKVVMNPPFDRGQWRAHVEHASAFLDPKPGSRLVAVLPESAERSKDLLPGWSLKWSEPIEFAGVSIKVVVLTAEPPC